MDIQLSQREKKILLFLLNNENNVTSEQLAKKFSISVRTIKYDIASIKEWLEQRNIQLTTKRGTGMRLAVPETDKLLLKRELLFLHDEDVSVNSELRKKKIMYELISAHSFLTSDTLSQVVDVTSNTILSDIDEIEREMKAFNLSLIRKNGKGFLIEGDELNKRLLLESLIQTEWSEYDIYQTLKRITSGNTDLTQYSVMSEVFQDINNQVLEVMSQILDCRHLNQLNDTDILSLIVRTTISVDRLRKRYNIGDYRLVSTKEVDESQMGIAYQLVFEVFAFYELPMFLEEYNYIQTDIIKEMPVQNVKQITATIINEVSEAMGYPFNRDKLLFTNLFAHLSVRLSKNHLFINEYNPFTVDVKAKYPELFQEIKRACHHVINAAEITVSDSFVVYLVLHFLVSYEKTSTTPAVRVVYVCSTGLGVTNLIQKKIEEAISGIEIVAFSSVLEVKEKIREYRPDILISIFPLEEMDVPFVKVSAIPSEEDIENIKSCMKKNVHLKSNQLRKVPLVPREATTKKMVVEQTQETIVTGYIVYQQLLIGLDPLLKQDIKESFLLHVLLMVHRILTDTQYQQETVTNLIGTEQFASVKVIEETMAKNNLKINESEVIALLQYVQA